MKNKKYKVMSFVFLLMFFLGVGDRNFVLGAEQSDVSNEYIFLLTGVCNGNTLTYNGDITISCPSGCQTVEGVGSCVQTSVSVPTTMPSPTPLPQFSECGNCESLGGGCPRPGECRVVNDWQLCKDNNQLNADGTIKTPCCLWDTKNCTGNKEYECGTFFNDLRCDMCHRYIGGGSCGALDTNCGSGAPARVRLKFPPTDSFVPINQEINLSWYAFGEEGPYIKDHSCAEKLPGSRARATDCRNDGQVKDDFAPYCSTSSSSDKSCWGYACVRGSMGIPQEWRTYEVLLKSPGGDRYDVVCTIKNIPDDLYQTKDVAKTSCKFVPTVAGDYQWYVRASFVDPSTGINAGSDSNGKNYGKGSFKVVDGSGQTAYSCDDQNNIMTVSWNQIPGADNYAIRVIGPDYDVEKLGEICSQGITKPASDKYFCNDTISPDQRSLSFTVEPGKAYRWWVSPVYNGKSGSDGSVTGWGQGFGKESVCTGNVSYSNCSIDGSGSSLAHIFWTKPEDDKTKVLDGGSGEVKSYVLRIKGQNGSTDDCTISMSKENKQEGIPFVSSTDFYCNSYVTNSFFDFTLEANKSYTWWLHPVYRESQQDKVDWNTTVKQGQITCGGGLQPTGVPEQRGECKYCSLRAENEEGEAIGDLSLMSLNDAVFLTTKGEASEHIIMARFRVVGGRETSEWCRGNGMTVGTNNWCETTNKNLKGEFFVPYTFTNNGQHIIESMLYGENIGWF